MIENCNKQNLRIVLEKKYKGKGLTSTAVEHVMNFAIKELEITTFEIFVHKTNIGSSRVAEKNGFIWKETLLNKFKPKGRPSMNMELYLKKTV